MKQLFQGRSFPIFNHFLTRSISATLTLSTMICGSSYAKTSSDQQADLIFQNGTVYTADAQYPEATAVAVKSGKIVYVGNNSGLKNWKGQQTQIVDLKGKMLLPGFIDTHNHAYLRAESMYWVNLGTQSLAGLNKQHKIF